MSLAETFREWFERTWGDRPYRVVSVRLPRPTFDRLRNELNVQRGYPTGYPVVLVLASRRGDVRVEPSDAIGCGSLISQCR